MSQYQGYFESSQEEIQRRRDEQRPSSPAQAQLYYRLCMERNVRPKDIAKMTYSQASDEIQKVQAFRPASPNQVSKIMELQEELHEYDNSYEVLPLKKVRGLHKDRASKFIAYLYEQLKEHSDKRPITDKQVEYIVSMFPCPAVDMNELGVPNRIETGRTFINNDGVEVKEWRKTLPSEVEKILRESVSQQEASQFIDKYRTEFGEWRRTRVSIKKREFIRTLEKRLADMYVPPRKVVEYTEDYDDNVDLEIVTKSTSGTPYSPLGYEDTQNGFEPIDEFFLRCMSNEDADKYIRILQSDLARRRQYNPTPTDVTFEDLRHTTDIKKAQIDELMALDRIIYALEDIAGYAVDDVHDAVKEYVIQGDKSDERVIVAKEKIRTFFIYLISEGYIGVDGLLEIFQSVTIPDEESGLYEKKVSCKTAEEILLGF